MPQKRLLKLGDTGAEVWVESRRETQARLELTEEHREFALLDDDPNGELDYVNTLYTLAAHEERLLDALDERGVPDHPEEGELISDQELGKLIGGGR